MDDNRNGGDGTSKNLLKISVRNLVEHSLRSGDLDLTAFGAGPGPDAAIIHNRIQRSRGDDSRYEVPVRHEIERAGYALVISGRIDSVFTAEDGGTVIEEVKTTTRDLRSLAETDEPRHWGQVRCYAYIHALQQGLGSVHVQLTYYNTESREIREIRRRAGFDELERFFNDLAADYLTWADRVSDWLGARNGSIAGLRFPFPEFRPGQEAIMDGVADTAGSRGQLLIQAATGIGKTMAVILPSLRALADGSANRIFYLTARTTGRSAAESALDLLRQQGLRLKSLSLVAKEKMCFNPDRLCNGDECEYARGFYDRLNSAVREALGDDSFTREKLLTLARRYGLCPFEFELELSLWVDVIICDYNYVFDPRVYLRRFFAEGPDECIFLVDEAHNLVDRGREMFSAALSKETVLAVKRAMRGQVPAVARRLSRINRWMLGVRKQAEEKSGAYAEKDRPEKLCDLIASFSTEAEKWLLLNKPSAFREQLLDLYYEARGFLRIAQRYDGTYATCYFSDGRDVRVKLACIDPARHLREGLERGSCAVFFSGTLTPVEYFSASFGCDEGVRSLVLPSPFPAGNLLVLVANRISALFKHREWTKHRVAAALSVLIRHKQGNYLVFFPSYEYLRMVHDTFTRENPAVTTIVQVPSMTEAEREVFIEHFDREPCGYLVGFAVMGGVFSESIDLMGDRLSGAAVVGVGMPQLSLEREIIREYYDLKDGTGYAFAYQIPGMIRVMQAAGRVIRSDSDRGIVLLIDTRYSGDPYRSMMPQEWRPLAVNGTADMEERMKRFWED